MSSRRFTEDKRDRRSRSRNRDRDSKPYKWGGESEGGGAPAAKPQVVMSESMRRLMETMAGGAPPPPPGAPPPEAFMQQPSPTEERPDSQPLSAAAPDPAVKPKVSNAMARLLAGGNIPKSALAPVETPTQSAKTSLQFKMKQSGQEKKGESWPFLPREKNANRIPFERFDDSDQEDDEKTEKGKMIYADGKKGARSSLLEAPPPAPRDSAPSQLYKKQMPKELVDVPAGVPPPPPLSEFRPTSQSATTSGGIKQPTLSASEAISGRNKQAGVACMQFKLGRCWYGAACKRVHEAPKGRLSAAEIYANHVSSFYQPVVAPSEPPPPPQGQH